MARQIGGTALPTEKRRQIHEFVGPPFDRDAEMLGQGRQVAAATAGQQNAVRPLGIRQAATDHVARQQGRNLHTRHLYVPGKTRVAHIREHTPQLQFGQATRQEEDVLRHVILWSMADFNASMLSATSV